MMRYTITQENFDAARTACACKSRLKVYHVGDNLFDKLTYEDAVWIEDELPEIAETIMNECGIPLYAMACSGSGHGSINSCDDGYGCGYGHGSSPGYVNGYGFSYGCGDGWGYGLGSGSGGGLGSGCGGYYGCGDGSGRCSRCDLDCDSDCDSGCDLG